MSAKTDTAQPDHPLPTSGGSYSRDPSTGELTPLPVEAPQKAAPVKPSTAKD